MVSKTDFTPSDVVRRKRFYKYEREQSVRYVNYVGNELGVGFFAKRSDRAFGAIGRYKIVYRTLCPKSETRE